MKVLFISAALVLTASFSEASWLSCKAKSCVDIQAPSNGGSWCEFANKSSFLVQVSGNESRIGSEKGGVKRQNGDVVLTFLDGDQQKQISLNERHLSELQDQSSDRDMMTGVLVEGYYYDQYHARYQQNLECRLFSR